MGYQRHKGSAHDEREWKSFLLDSHSLISQSIIPLEIIESTSLWSHFLSHGFAPLPNGTTFTIEKLDKDDIDNIKALIVAYLAAGLPDVLSIWGEEVDQSLRNAARRLKP